jgi:hypothetical protein
LLLQILAFELLSPVDSRASGAYVPMLFVEMYAPLDERSRH